MTTAAQRPPLNTVNAIIFVGFPLSALILVPAWGVYHGFDAFQWLWALAFLYLQHYLQELVQAFLCLP